MTVRNEAAAGKSVRSGKLCANVFAVMSEDTHKNKLVRLPAD